MRRIASTEMSRAAAKPALAALAALALAALAGACGSSSGSQSARTASGATPATPHQTTTAKKDPETVAVTEYTRIDADRDNDLEAAEDDTNNNAALRFGQSASPGDRRAIEALVRRYYEVALAGEAAKGCSMLYSLLVESAVEDYAGTGGLPYAQGAKNCQEVLADVFRFYHARLVALVPKLGISDVRLQGGHGYAVLSFGRLPERELLVSREGHTWRIGAFMDSELP
jgi:hypothetical protein